MFEALDIAPGCEQWLPWAQGLLRKLKAVLNAAGQNIGRREILTPDGALVIVRTRRAPDSNREYMPPFSPDLWDAGWMDSIRIEASDSKVHGFLCYKDGVPRITVDTGHSRASFQAYYVDGKVERIRWQAPIGAEGEEYLPVAPLPPMATPARSLGYKVPDELKDVYIDGVLQPRLLGYNTASRHSGLMRGVVGNYHGRGKDAPFAYWWAKTHGRVKMAPTAVNPTVPQYWIVEITQAGVYAAPVTESTWDVSKYMPTSTMIAEQPGLQQFKTTLSLAWAHDALPNAGVTLLEANVGPAYAGTPFYVGHGWAFNYSGTEAQGISYVWNETPAQHYACSRYKLTFSLSGTNQDGTGILTCAFIVLDNALPATFYGSQVMWTPAFVGEWGYVPQVDAAHQAASLAQYPNQDAPVHVYYAGDTEMVTRWNYTTHSSAEDTTNTPLSLPGLVHIGEFGYHNYYYGKTDFVVLYYGDPGSQLTAYTVTPNTWRKQFGTGVTAGFVSPGFNTSTEARSYTLTDDTIESVPATETSGNGTDTGGGWIWDYHWVALTGSTQRRTVRTGTRTNRGSIVLLLQEREAVIGLIDQTRNDSVVAQHEQNNANLGISYQGNGRNTGHHLDSYSNANNYGGSWPWGTFSIVTDSTTPDTSYSADAILMLCGFVHQANAIGNADLMPFLISGLLIGEHPVLSQALAMHGNLYAADATITPADQKANRVVRLDAGAPAVFGGFTAPTDTNPFDAIAFVGKA